MHKVYWAFNIVFLPILATYVCYVGMVKGYWEFSLLLFFLSVTSIANYCQAFGEPTVRAREDSYQDDHINGALSRISALEQELNDLKREKTE